MNSTTPFHYAIYTRQSKSSDAVMSSCDAQFALCEDFVKMRAAPNWQWIGERFDDEQMPGDRLHRPGLARLREQIRAGTVQYVVVYALDRLSRKMTHCLKLVNEMLEHDVEFSVVLNPDLDTTTGKGQVLTGVLAALAEFEHDLIKSRIRDKFDFLRKKGRRLAGRVPFGYSADSGNKQLVIDETEAPLVKMMFTLAAQGRLPREIAETLNALSTSTSSADADASSNRAPWTPRQVLSVLANPVYTGRFANADGSVREGLHVPIVDDELFQSVRDQVASRRPKASRPRRKEDPTFKLRGVVFCGRCERLMSTHTVKTGKNTYRTYYRCRSHAGGRPPCKGVGVPVYDLQAYIIDQLLSEDLHEGLNRQEIQPIKKVQQTLRTYRKHVDLTKLFPHLVSKIVYDPDTSTIALTWNYGQMRDWGHDPKPMQQLFRGQDVRSL